MDIFDDRYFKINKFVLSCIGQWTYQTIIKKRLARTLIILSLTTALIPQFNFLFSTWGDIDATCECLPPLILVILCCCQVGFFTFNEKKLLSLLDAIRRDWKGQLSGRELEILKNHAKRGRDFSILYAGNVYIAVFTFVSMSMTPIVLDKLIPLNETRPRQLVYAAKFPLNEDKYLHWILFHGSITAFYNLSVLFGCEALMAVTTQHVCGMFSIISYRLKNIGKPINDSSKIPKEWTKDQIYKEITSSINLHIHALGYAKTLDSFFSPILFCTVALNTITLSLLGIQTLNSTGKLDQTLKYGAFGCACLVHLFCISLPAQNLTDCSSEVADEAYNGYWYLIPLKTKKLLTMIIIRGQIPCSLNAGKLCTMGMVTFSMLLKTSVSYFTVLSSMQ